MPVGDVEEDLLVEIGEVAALDPRNPALGEERYRPQRLAVGEQVVEAVGHLDLEPPVDAGPVAEVAQELRARRQRIGERAVEIDAPVAIAVGAMRDDVGRD